MTGPARDYVGYGGKPPKVEWPNGARVAVSIVVNYEEGSERSILDGDPRGETGTAEVSIPNWEPGKRDLAMESMYEYGSRAGFWRLLDILDERGVPATFFSCAVALERTPAGARAIVEHGHEVCSHGYRWEDVTQLGRDVEREHIRLAVESIERTTGSRPLGWYCRYGPSEHTRELVVEEGGFEYDSDSYNDDLPYWTEVGGKRHLVVPYTLDVNDIKFGQGGLAVRDFQEYMAHSLDRLWKEGARAPKMMSIGLHQRLAGHPARAEAFDRFLEYANAKGGVWFARRIDIARHWKEHHG
ncbi:MAG: allantoinase PuuE [Dehalococcoidia bacterium]|jgi:peptidoglycan/xylan/chitin deacetylase (PgdA/CDA1 family)